MKVFSHGMIVTASTCLLVGACSSNAQTSCGGDATLAALSASITDKIVSEARNDAETTDQKRALKSSTLKSIIDDFKFALNDVRTVRDDPDSTKLFCGGKLSVTVPQLVFDKADSARSIAEMDSLADLADIQDIDLKGTSFTIDAEYTVQPTDDGMKIVTELDGAEPFRDLLKELLVSAALEQKLKAERAEADREQAAVEREEKRAADAVEEANKAAATANLNEAKAALNLVNERLNGVWNAMPKSQRQALLPLQRAWLAKRTAECRVESLGSSEVAEIREANRLQCEARWGSARADALDEVRMEFDEGEPGAEAAAEGG